MSSPVAVFGPGKKRISALESRILAGRSVGWNKVLTVALRGSGKDFPGHSDLYMSAAAGPEARITEIAALPEADESAYTVSPVSRLDPR